MGADNQIDILGDGSFSDDLLEHLDDIPEEVRRKWPKDLAALMDIFDAALKRHGLPKEKARELAHVLIAEQSNYCGGRYFYLAKGDVLKQAIRDVELFRDWHDNNILPDDLASKYKLSVQHIYRIIKEQRAIHLRKVQPGLF